MTEADKPALKTPTEWADEEGYSILQPNGWVGPDAPSFDTPITYSEFHVRALNSVIGPPPGAETVTISV